MSNASFTSLRKTIVTLTVIAVIAAACSEKGGEQKKTLGHLEPPHPLLSGQYEPNSDFVLWLLKTPKHKRCYDPRIGLMSVTGVRSSEVGLVPYNPSKPERKPVVNCWPEPLANHEKQEKMQ